jgi:dimethylamine/trimethylamine dehydrogenase
MRDPRYDILFEPVRIGPLVTRNRFYQVPHCTGMGHRHPLADARHREVKAEGGWGVVCSQEVEIHPSSDLTPSNEGRLWDDADIGPLREMTDRIHAHGSLAAIELAHNGLHSANRLSRIPPYAPTHAVVDSDEPSQARAMDKADIREFRRWHREAALRARTAGFDIIYVYAGHQMTLLHHFLLARHNHRSDEYGGSFDNRLRLFREVIGDTRDAIGDRCALAVRLAVDELLGDAGFRHGSEGHDVVAALAEEPDLWDVNLSTWANDSQVSRFSQEGYQEDYIRFVKPLTSKPVVGVGRYTSPDAMVRAIRQGVLDLIGAARPSIADPFLPNKIRDGRIEEIRECIGCNICAAGDNTSTPMRCTQNPTVGEEWRKDWHPEAIPKLSSPEAVLIVGGGPAGLEAARALVQRGATVTVAEAKEEWGGRVSRESRLPGLATWARVRDWRMGRLQVSPDVQLYLGNRLTADDVLGLGVSRVAIATGARWRTDGMGRAHRMPLPWLANGVTVGVDALLDGGAGVLPAGPVVVFDDDRYYMASVLAELLAMAGHDVAYVTPAPIVAPWTVNTLEQERIQVRLLSIGVKILPLSQLNARTADSLTIGCVYTGRPATLACAALVPVTSREPVDELWLELAARRDEWADHGIHAVERIGDCLAPGTIAAANYDGHAYARRMGGEGTHGPQWHR